MNRRNFYISESAARQQIDDLHFRKAEPHVGIHFARLLEPVLQEVHHHHAAARLQNAPRLLATAAGWMQRVMQTLVEQREVDLRIADRQLLQIAEPVLEILRRRSARATSAPYSTIFSELSTAITRFARCASSSESVPSPAPRSAIAMRRHQLQQHLRQPFQLRPGT